MKKNIKVLCLDPGYSLEDSLRKFKEGNFPGQALYGINHFDKNGVNCTFEEEKQSVGEESRGNSRFQILKQMVEAEKYSIKTAKADKSIDAIYIPLVNFYPLFCLARKMRIIKKPVIGVVHDFHTKGKARRIKNRFMFEGMDRTIFIARNVYDHFCISYPKYKSKACCIPLMPEILDESGTQTLQETKKYDACLIGKTARDYKTFAEAAKLIEHPFVIVGGGTSHTVSE